MILSHRLGENIIMDNRTLQLESNEYIVFSEGESTLNVNEEKFKLFISNLNLILLKENTYLFKKSIFEVTKWPIDKIIVIDGIPQVKVEHGEPKTWIIEICFSEDVKRIEFYYESRLKKNHMKKHVEKIASLLSNLRKQVVNESRNKSNENSSSKIVEDNNDITIKTIRSNYSSHKSEVHRKLYKKGFTNYEIVTIPNRSCYIDYRAQMFAIKDFSGLKIMKFKDFKGYSIDYDNVKSSTRVDYRGGAFEGALTGNVLAKSFVGKSAAKIGTIAGGLAKSIVNTNVSLGSNLAARVVIRYKTHNETIELSDLSSLKAYRPFFDILDKISSINKN